MNVGQAIGVLLQVLFLSFETGVLNLHLEKLLNVQLTFLGLVPVDYLLGRSDSRELDADMNQKYLSIKKPFRTKLPEEHQEIVLQNMLTMMESLKEKLKSTSK